MANALPNDIYKVGLSLETDLYQLSMAQTYLAAGMQDYEAVFHLYFRRLPFGGKWAIAAGLAQALDLIENMRFTDEDVRYLMSLDGNDGKPLFTTAFLRWLRNLTSAGVEVAGIPEGSAVFPDEPLLRVKGPLAAVQLLETQLLTVMNFQTLIATKAARVKQAAKGKSVLEFGLRRAQGLDGGLSASRAAYIGGADATSNVLAGKLFGIPVKGTHAHSMVMAFGDEREAFSAYSRACPNNVTLLVDTYDAIEGIRHAISTYTKEIAPGHLSTGKGFAIRLDSGDLADLSKRAKAMFLTEGLVDAKIVASSDLDEYEIAKLEEAGAPIDVYGVGTNLVTAKDQPALGGVYKLAAIRATGKPWDYRIKVSEVAAKTTTPGILCVRRWTDKDGLYVADVIGDDGEGTAMNPEGYDRDGNLVSLPHTTAQWHSLVRPADLDYTPFQQPAYLNIARTRALQDAALFARATETAPYKVLLSRELYRRKAALTASAKSAA